MNKQIMIIAGEVSGDMHAARLVEQLKILDPTLTFFGVGGTELRKAGVDTLYDIKDTAVVGLVEVLKRYGFFRRMFENLLAIAAKRRPAAVILVDYPGFNLRFAKKTHALGLKNIYYICPQVWAWNKGRIPEMARTLDMLMPIFPFEAKHFEGSGLSVKFPGHPLIDEAGDISRYETPVLPWRGSPRVALLPGSRRNEISKILPAMLEASAIIENRHPDASFMIPTPTEDIDVMVRDMIAHTPIKAVKIDIVRNMTRNVMKQATAGLIKSGTATIEASLMECPMVITYKAAALTYHIFMTLVSIKDFGMVNIVAGKRICPELIQVDCNAKLMADAIEPLLSNTDQRNEMLKEIRAANSLLGSKGASARAAEFVHEAINKPS